MAKGKKYGGRDFLPGNNANPRGQNAHNPELKVLQNLTRKDIADIASVLVHCSILELQRIESNPGNSGLKAAAASAILKAHRTGDWTMIDRLLDRVVGKVKDEIVVTPGLQSLTDEELDARLKELEAKS